MTSLVKADFCRPIGTVKPMHSVNNGPIAAAAVQKRGNFETFRALKIPYTRNHDANHCTSYGGPHTVDVHAVFPDFDADENDPESYDFACTDKYTGEIMAADSKVFYRLGASIEHTVKKYNIFPPKDYLKWARICEHIIRHYTEGWAQGFQYDIMYWEIWNEPDLETGATWGGSREQFFEFYETAARHLKDKFPCLKIGGPALAHNEEWADEFLKRMHEKDVPIDFFSWHIYCVEPEKMVAKAGRIRTLLDNNGYSGSESICNEWNYVRGWTEDWVYSLTMMAAMKGAAFVGACMLACQHAPVDMLMYYDARPSCLMNCIFDSRTLQPLKGYHVLKMFSSLYQLGTEALSEAEGDGIYSVAAKNEAGECGCMIVSYTDDDNASPHTVKLNLGQGKWEMTLVDENHSGELMGTIDGNVSITLEKWAAVLLRQL